MNTMIRSSSGFLALVAALLTLLAASLAGAQETTSSIRGVVIGPDGSPSPNTSVRIVDTRTGAGRTLTTNDSGVFSSSGLRVGGPYTVTVDSAQYTRKTVNDVYLELGDTFNLTVPLSTEQIEEVFVTAAAVQTAQTAVGPSSAFNLSDLQSAPAINRDIKDVLRIDPRIYVDEAFADAIQCGGANPRFNSLTVDGVRLNDNFGLNSNGYPTQRIPFSFDAIEQIAVELAPFDVQYGGFTACNVNAVTKSGTNEFHGTAFADYTDDGLRGDSLEGDSFDTGDFDETRYGISLGGPIIKDKLFFFTAYEKLEGADLFDRGPAGSGAAREVDGVSQAQFDEILDIAQNIYGYDPGGLPSSLDVEDEKWLVKLDWEINDDHRAAFTYNYNDGFNISQSDSDSNELEFSNHYYERGAELNAYTAQLFSNWSDVFSTEVRVNYAELDNRQLSLAGVDFGEVQITTFNDPDGDGIDSRATVYLGADDSRHANKLKYDITSYKFAGNYILGEHTLSFGFEREEFDVFNLFIQEAEGEYRFSSIDDFRNGTPNRITYENASPSNVKDDAAANFQYEINTFYLQDEFVWPNTDLTIVAGVRWDQYTSGDVPRNNAAFEDTYGFSNSRNLDGEDLIQPRLGFNWDLTDDFTVRGGVGLYSGGNPNVWLSNNYSNDGVTQIEVQDRTLDDGTGDTLFTIPFNGSGRPIFDIPQDLFDAVAAGAGRTGGINSLNEDFEIPSEWKYAIGATYDFDLPGGLGSDYTFNADILISQQNDAAVIVDGSRTQVGTAPDGRPIYSGIVNIGNPDPACQADPNADNCGTRSQDFLLSNANDDGFNHSYSVALSKSYDWGLDWTLGYAYTESSDVNPMTSSVAFSNYSNIAVSDPNDPGRAQSNYEIPNRITLRLNYERAFFGDNLTKITLFGTANEGRPFTYTYTDGFSFGDSVGFIGRHLIYVPTGPNDPNVDFTMDAATQAAFFDFLSTSGLNEFAGEIVPRNAFHSDWWTKFDLRVEQEFPGFAEGHKISTFLLIENLGNLLNDDWGVLKEASFPRYQSILDVSINDDGIYEYSDFFEPQSQSRVTDASTWELRFGFKYDF